MLRAAPVDDPQPPCFALPLVDAQAAPFAHRLTFRAGWAVFGDDLHAAAYPCWVGYVTFGKFVAASYPAGIVSAHNSPLMQWRVSGRLRRRMGNSPFAQRRTGWSIHLVIGPPECGRRNLGGWLRLCPGVLHLRVASMPRLVRFGVGTLVPARVAA
jgi:hypothetical protein